MTLLRLEEFTDTRSIDKLVEVYEVLCEERLSVKDTGVNYRVINHWDEMGIIRFIRNVEGGNRKFNFVDFIWIKVVNELRSFGVKLPDIQKIASEIYKPLPVMELFDTLANNLELFNGLEGESKDDLMDFLKKGEYKNTDFDALNINLNFNHLHILIAEAISTRNSVSIIVFNDGEWFPFIKQNEHLYSKELLYKKEYSSQVRINITELIFKYIMEDYLIEYANGLHLFTQQESKLLNHIKVGDYKKVIVKFKSKKHEPIEIIKSKKAQEEIIHIFREKKYREFILTDKKGIELITKNEESKKIESETPFLDFILNESKGESYLQKLSDL